LNEIAPSRQLRRSPLIFAEDNMKRFVLLLTLLSCATSFIYSQELNERPMYDGINKTPEMIRADNDFVDYMVRTFGSRDKAADDAIRRGFEFLAKADWRMAMKRFNQAWLLAPDKPEVTWGFGATLSYEGKFEDSEKYFQKATAQAPTNGRLLTDFGFLYQFWATKGTKDKTERLKRLDRSIELFEQAARLDPTNERTYFDWAVSLYFKKDYAGAWEKINEAERLGGKTIDRKFIADLKKKMERP
jgi:tetratricopeptide (TPR) repeat protein